jgi:hypothetical protein
MSKKRYDSTEELQKIHDMIRGYDLDSEYGEESPPISVDDIINEVKGERMENPKESLLSVDENKRVWAAEPDVGNKETDENDLVSLPKSDHSSVWEDKIDTYEDAINAYENFEPQDDFIGGFTADEYEALDYETGFDTSAMDALFSDGYEVKSKKESFFSRLFSKRKREASINYDDTQNQNGTVNEGLENLEETKSFAPIKESSPTDDTNIENSTMEDSGYMEPSIGYSPKSNDEDIEFALPNKIFEEDELSSTGSFAPFSAFASKTFIGTSDTKSDDIVTVCEEVKKGSTALFLRFMGALLLSIAMVAVGFYKELGLESTVIGLYLENKTVYVIWMFALYICVCLCAFDELLAGFKGIISLESKNTGLLSFSSVVVLIDAIFTLKGFLAGTGELSFFAPVVAWSIVFTLLGQMMIKSKIYDNLSAVIAQEEITKVQYVKSDELSNSLLESSPTSGSKIVLFRAKNDDPKRYKIKKDLYEEAYVALPYEMPAIFAGIVVCSATVAIFTKSLYALTHTFAAMSVASCSFIGILSFAIPFVRSSSRMLKRGAAVVDFDAVNICSDTDGVIMSDEDLFPKESVTLKGMRIYGDRKIGDIIIDAASVLRYEDSALGRIFLDMVERNNKILREITSTTVFGSDGIISEVESREVIIGTYEFLGKNGILMPDERQPRSDSNTVRCYISVSGELCCAFSIEYAIDETVSDTVRSLSKNDISILLRGSVIGLSRIALAERFGIRINTIARVSDDDARELEKEEAQNTVSDGLFIKSPSVWSLAALLLACRRFSPCIARNRIIKIFSTFLTPFFVFLFSITGASGQVTPFNIFISMLLWIIPVLFNSFTA